MAAGFDAELDSAHSIRLTIPGQPQYVRLGRLALSGLARSHSLSPEDLGDLKLALTEAYSLRRASPESDATVEIHYELHEDRLVVELTDEGEGFVVEEVPPLSEPAVGLAIIRALADELEVGPRVDGDGSRLRFVKRFR